MDNIIGIASVVVCVTTAILAVWDPMYRYPLLPILQTLSALLWLAYGIALTNMILIVGESLCLAILLIGFCWRYTLSPRPIYTRMETDTKSIT